MGRGVGLGLGYEDLLGASEEASTQLFFLEGEGLVMRDLLPLSFLSWLRDLLILISCSASTFFLSMKSLNDSDFFNYF